MFSPKTLWFDAGELDLAVGDDVVVQTSRGLEFATLVQPVKDVSDDETKALATPLKPVKRRATEEDRAQADELAAKSVEALPVFKKLAAETVPEMNPVSVEFLFDGDKAVFYFESEDRLDFRDLVRKLASEFHVRVDMKQIGVRDEARMVGGLGHCGQELCCRRLGGEFNPVSIRMAKEQDLSLNPQKISGVCGRLMCCLRYEYDAYKDFHARAPKKNAKIATPDGEGKVVDLDAVRETVSIKVDNEKPIKVPLADMDVPEDGGRPTSVGAKAWEKAQEPATFIASDALSLFGQTDSLTGADKLADPGHVRRVHGDEPEQPKRRRRGQSAGKQVEEVPDSTAPSHQTRRRRSTTVAADGTATVQKEVEAKPEQVEQPAKKSSSRRRRRGAKKADGSAQASKAQGQASDAAQAQPQEKGKGKAKAATHAAQQKQQGKQARPGQEKQSVGSQVGRKSSALRVRREQAENAAGDSSQASAPTAHRRPRRRSRKSGAGAEGSQEASQG